MAIILINGCDFFSPVSEVSLEKLPKDTSSKLVVGCFISPQDSVVRVSLTESIPLYDTLNKFPLVENARIILYNERKDSLVIDRLVDGYYIKSTHDFPVYGGKTYHLVVKAGDGRTARASSTIPLYPVPITDIVIDSVFLKDITFGNDPADSTVERYASIRWNDPTGANYYRVTGYLNQSGEMPTETGSVPNDIMKLLYFDEENSRMIIQSDKNQDGGKMQSANGIYSRGNDSIKITKQQIVMSLLNIDSVYYNYYQSINRYNQTEGNPFAEPANIEGNIEGGYGCFASYNESKITLQIQ